MPKIAFIGAGSTVFARNVLGDVMLTPALCRAEIALHDIDPVRLDESEAMLKNINKNCNENRARIVSFEDRREALRDATYVACAIQVGGYKPATVIDIEVPKKFGLRQTIGDTLGIGGIFRGLRTLPVFFDIARDMEELCPGAWLLNYVNPMAIITGAMLRYTNVKTVGLCHSYQVCADTILRVLDMPRDDIRYKIAGINHMAWLLEIRRGREDLYPEIRRRAAEGADLPWDWVRVEMLRRFGYYVTESSEHNAEYLPYFIKSNYPDLIDEYKIPLDEIIRRYEKQGADWEQMRDELVHNPVLTHVRTNEYASYIMEAMENNMPINIGGNVLNTGLIPNLPGEAVVELPCLVDAFGVQGTYIGNLPEQLAALNRTNINVQLLTIAAHITGKREHIYHAAMTDPHTAAELSLDHITALCDEMIAAHGDFLPKYR